MRGVPNREFCVVIVTISERHIIKGDGHTGLFQYYIKVVPTVYTSEFGFKYVTNQFTVSQRFREFSLQPGGQVICAVM